MLTQRPIKPLGSLKRFNTSDNRSMIFYRKRMPSARNAMINIEFHTNSKWVIRFGCICRKSAPRDPIGSFVHFNMGLTPSPRLWVTILLN